MRQLSMSMREHISELGFRFGGKDKSSRCRNRDHLRRLLFERMEDRRLLAVIDLAVLLAAQGSTIFGAETGDGSGVAVNSVGDVNGDGYDDLFIGAAWGDASGNLKANAGDSYLIFGGPTLATQIDLASLGSVGVTIFGADAGDRNGFAVSSAGDFNGDGYDDIIIGAYLADGVGNLKANAGESYVIFGGASLPTTIDLANLGSAGITIFGADADDNSGNRVNSAGDVNGDGYDDLIIGANQADAAGNLKPDAGESYVIFGGPSVLGSIDLASLDSAGITIFGADAFDNNGRVSSAGDVNADGFDDLIIGANGADGPNNLQDFAGESYVIFGGAFLPATIDLASLGSAGITIFGAEIGDMSGRSVSSAGDLNSDGYDDIIIGAYLADGVGNLKPGAGESYVIFGGASLPTTINLANLGSAGITIFGADADDLLGNSTLGSIGDFNADGFDDLHIGADNADAAGNLKPNAGDSYVIFGGASLPTTIDLANLGSAGITIFGADVDDDGSGRTVSSTSDINGDGFNDLIIGASQADAAGNLKPNAGESYVIFGGNGFTSSVTPLGTANAETLTGTAAADMMNGGRGNDTLIGSGGADVLTGGQGNDVLAVSDLTFKRLVGGTGSDTLRLDGSGLSLNLTTLANNRLLGIETIDITGSGSNTLTLNQREVLNLSDESNTLVVPCDAGDVVNIGSGWTQGASEGTFSVFTQGAAKLKVSSSGTIVATIASPAVFVTPTLGLFTSEAFGQATFTVRLGSPPTADVAILVSSSNTNEGTVSTSSLTFTSANWSQPKTVTITGVNDDLLDGSIVYTIMLGAAASTDPLYNELDPTDVTVTNTDNDTKFYVVNASSTSLTYRYDTFGSSIGNSALNTGNTSPRGAASTIAGDKVWVVDTNRKVFVYNTGGGLLGSWTAGSMSASSQPDGITVNGNDVWIVDNKTDKVFKYAGAASRLSGSQNAASSSSLNTGNKNPKDLVTDGISIWVVDDSTTDKVFKYSASGAFQGSWTILSGGGSPTGITLDPSNASQSLWIVDRSTYSVYEYANARGNSAGSQAANMTFLLAAGNTNAQGIADPPPPSSSLIAAPASIVSNSALMQAPIVWLGVPSTERAAQSQSVSAETESVDEFMSQLASQLPVAPMSVSKLQSTPLLSRTRFAEDQSIDLTLADEELHDSLHTIATDLFESTLR